MVAFFLSGSSACTRARRLFGLQASSESFTVSEERVPLGLSVEMFLFSSNGLCDNNGIT